MCRTKKGDESEKEKTNLALLLRVELLAPGLHDKGVVDGHDVHVAGLERLLARDVARDVRLGAAGACGRTSGEQRGQ